MVGAGATGRIIAGIALIAFAIIVPAGAIGLTSMLSIGLAGASLVIGGLAQLLTPTPSIPKGVDSPNDPRKNYSFSSIQNTSRQGTPVPVVYGETIVGSVVVSAGIDIDQVAA